MPSVLELWVKSQKKMEEQIKRTVRRMKCAFIAYWLLPVALLVAGESGDCWVGMYAGDELFTFYAETAEILLLAVCVPVAFKLFVRMLDKINRESLPKALRLYLRWVVVRLLLLLLPVLAGEAVYYLTLSTTGMLCSFMGLAASFFCLPGEGRLRNELYIGKGEA